MMSFLHAKLQTMLAGGGGGWSVARGSTHILNSYAFVFNLLDDFACVLQLVAKFVKHKYVWNTLK